MGVVEVKVFDYIPGKGEEVSSEKGDNADKEEVERTEEGTAE
jgi:hypothetical protein